ncbi:fluoride efflux transporter CrcB [Chengkuizengella axinellae]|uniref:Fluoride-specific ion channel FluC n=1 Tax=Chengkuizengella axinellae TaxID=3064388 RepID=A0ABT9IVC2_9BACL|nr:fluoride efflux transporter CrcB [Chengkuizengella sp. 2205SS18-9]MDP5273311.1 fluoride efflux transporter CrcB [Chengkuizengella sp. 2205SS18-9]
MNVIQLFLVGIGGFLGAVSRYYVSSVMTSRFSTEFPYGTLTVNLIGSFLLGLLFGIHSGFDELMLFFATGFLGAFTTFSTFKVESVKLFVEQKWKPLILYIGLSYVLGILLAYIGFIIGMK